jgi:hypothetical protein
LDSEVTQIAFPEHILSEEKGRSKQRNRRSLHLFETIGTRSVESLIRLSSLAFNKNPVDVISMNGAENLMD